MSTYEVLKLCIINLEEDAVDRIVKVLRSAGLPAQTVHLSGEESLADNLKSQNPDIVIVGTYGNADIAHVSAICRQQIPNSPRLLLDSINGENRTTALKFHYDDLVDIGSESWLLHVITREWARYKNIRKLDSLQIELSAISQSHDMVVENSDKGIAYVCDGLHMNSTQRYAKMFEFSGESEVEITPFIDIIADNEQDNFKLLLRNFERCDDTVMTIETTALTRTQKPIPVRFEISKSSFEQEKALQIIATASAYSSTQDGGKNETNAFLKQLDYFLNLANTKHEPGCVIGIQPWNFWKTRHRVGIVDSSQILADLHDFVVKKVDPQYTISKIGNDFFAIILHNTSPPQALDIANTIAHSVEEHIFEVGGISVNCYFRAGIVPYDNKTGLKAQQIINQAFEVIGTFATAETSEKARIYEPPKDEPSDFDPNQTFSNIKTNNEITLFYQPVISLRGDSNELYEVVPIVNSVRLSPIERGGLAQAQLTEKKESKFDRWLINLALSKLRPHLRSAPKTRLILELSPYALSDRTLLPWFLAQCKKINMQHQHLAFQFRTDDITDRLKIAPAFFALMRKARLQYCFSEFTPDIDAYKTLTTLKPDLLKIDDALALGSREDSKKSTDLDQLLVRASELETSVIVPSVNEADTLASLWQSPAAYVQGDYFTAPTPNMDYGFNDMG